MRIAFFSPPLQGHLGPAGCLAEALQRRGHQCFLLAHSEMPLPGTGFEPIHLPRERSRWTPQGFVELTRSPGFPFGVSRLVRGMAALTDYYCAEGPALLREHGIDGVVSDQMEPAGTLVAERLGLPVVTLAAAHPINREPLVPLAVLPWPYEDSASARRRNRAGTRIADWLTAPHDRVVRRWSAVWGLSHQRAADCLSPLADLAQGVPGLDFPREHLPESFHYVGRLRSERLDRVADLPAGLGARPFIYASMGTLQGHRVELFRRIAASCRLIGVQLLVSHSGGLTPSEAATIDADWVLPWVDQAAVIARASAVVTHGGYNTVLDTLAAGLPMLCLPLAFEQPGIGARLTHSGAGRTLSPRASARSMADALQALLEDGSYKARARALGDEIARAGGSKGAAAMVEQALSTGYPVRDAFGVAA